MSLIPNVPNLFSCQKTLKTTISDELAQENKENKIS